MLFYGIRYCQIYSFGIDQHLFCSPCQPIRNMRGTLLSEMLDISYNATKKIIISV